MLHGVSRLYSRIRSAQVNSASTCDDYAILPFSIRERRTIVLDTNAVIYKFVVHAWNFDLGHMTTHAIQLANPAHESTVIIPGAGAGILRVALQTNMIVRPGLVSERLVRIVTGTARQPALGTNPTQALLEPKRLKANSRDTSDTHLDYVSNCAMARTAKIDKGWWI
jgi:hypothetical protein